MRRMGSGLLPQLLCWLLMALGGVVLLQGLLERAPADAPALSPATAPTQASEQSQGRENYGSIAFVATSLVAFALSIETLGLIAAISLLVLIASFAYRGLGWLETLLTTLVLIALCWVVFILGLGMPARMLPDLQALGL